MFNCPPGCLHLRPFLRIYQSKPPNQNGKMCLVFSDPAVGEDFYLIFVLDEADIANTVRPGYDGNVVITDSRSSKILSSK